MEIWSLQNANFTTFVQETAGAVQEGQDGTAAQVEPNTLAARNTLETQDHTVAPVTRNVSPLYARVRQWLRPVLREVEGGPSWASVQQLLATFGPDQYTHLG